MGSITSGIVSGLQLREQAQQADKKLKADMAAKGFTYDDKSGQYTPSEGSDSQLNRTMNSMANEALMAQQELLKDANGSRTWNVFNSAVTKDKSWSMFNKKIVSDPRTKAAFNSRGVYTVVDMNNSEEHLAALTKYAQEKNEPELAAALVDGGLSDEELEALIPAFPMYYDDAGNINVTSAADFMAESGIQKFADSQMSVTNTLDALAKAKAALTGKTVGYMDALEAQQQAEAEKATIGVVKAGADASKAGAEADLKGLESEKVAKWFEDNPDKNWADYKREMKKTSYDPTTVRYEALVKIVGKEEATRIMKDLPAGADIVEYLKNEGKPELANELKSVLGKTAKTRGIEESAMSATKLSSKYKVKGVSDIDTTQVNSEDYNYMVTKAGEEKVDETTIQNINVIASALEGTDLTDLEGSTGAIDTAWNKVADFFDVGDINKIKNRVARQTVKNMLTRIAIGAGQTGSEMKNVNYEMGGTFSGDTEAAITTIGMLKNAKSRLAHEKISSPYTYALNISPIVKDIDGYIYEIEATLPDSGVSSKLQRGEDGKVYNVYTKDGKVVHYVGVGGND